MEAICADDPLSQVDLLCLGCVISSIATWQVFIYDYFEEDRWPMLEELPPTSGIPCGDIIKKCWDDKYRTICIALRRCHRLARTDPLRLAKPLEARIIVHV